jgi:hypothetical protein
MGVHKRWFFADRDTLAVCLSFIAAAVQWCEPRERSWSRINAARVESHAWSSAHADLAARAIVEGARRARHPSCG